MKTPNTRGAVQAPLNPNFGKGAGKILIGAPSPGKSLGYAHSPLKLEYPGKARIIRNLRSQNLPGSYDLRKLGRVSPVKDQDGSGTCWAFASYGSMESCLLPEELWDFSENNMKNQLSQDCPLGYDRTPDDGGNQFMATAYLSRWSGPATEAEDPFNPLAPAECLEFAAKKHLTRAIYVPDRKNPGDNEILKTAIMTYGAVFSTLHFEDRSYQGGNFAYYYSGNQAANHAICLVGWNDDYDRNLFNTRPPKNGAFIVKNSWGQEWGDQGYFYVSYYDALIGTNNALFNRSGNPDQYNLVYQYDPLGWVSSIGYGQTSGWMANIFSSPGSNHLEAVSWYAASPASNYELYIYRNPGSADPRSGTLVQTLKGTVEAPSYFTRVLASPIAWQTGERFSMVLKLDTPGFLYPVPVEMPIAGYSSQSRAEAGQSFISEDGQKWDDISTIWENTNVCIKGFARS